MHRFPALVPFVAIACVTTIARADVPPDPGQKRVPVGFIVKGMNVAPDRVLFAYPCSDSNGAPMMEHRKLEEGVNVSVGRRGGPCTIYSVAKPVYEEWAKDRKPAPPSAPDPTLDALVAKATRCAGSPTLSGELPITDPRTSVTQTLEVTTLNATACVLNPLVVPRSATTMPTSAPASAPAATTKSSCAAAPGSSAGAGFVAALALVLVARRRRVR